jgi:hypothetical protein
MIEILVDHSSLPIHQIVESTIVQQRILMEV